MKTAKRLTVMAFPMSMVKRALKWLIAEAPTKIFDRPLPPLTRDQDILIKDFRDNISHYSADVQSSSSVTAQWKDNIKRFEKAVVQRDPREFLRWEECFPLRAGPGVFPQYLALRKSENWKHRWRSVLEDAPIGHPLPFFLYPRVGANIILHAYHMNRFERFAGKLITDFDAVVEFGGGYGGMCYLIHKLGFKGKYIIFDLPVQTLLQIFYLKGAGMPVISDDAKTSVQNGITIQSDLSNFKAYFQKIITICKGPKLFIATWSLSESPVSLREDVSRNIIDYCDHILITFQESFDGIDNVAYFKRWKESHHNVFAVEQDRMFMRKPADFYFFGKRHH